jgi:Ca2+-binding RTX toxin-like protein
VCVWDVAWCVTRIRMIWLLVVSAVLAAPASAVAATVRIAVTPGNAHDGTPPSSQVDVVAMSAERNVVAITREPLGTWLVRDTGAALHSGAGCVAVDVNTARCTTPAGAQEASSAVSVQTGDRGADVTVAPSISAIVRGGDGDDTLRASGFLDGGRGADALIGGPGPDSLTGGPGADVLRAGAGADTLVGDGGSPAAPSDDVLDGGSGLDTASYKSRAAPVRVDLADPGGDGAQRENDRLRSIEDLIGGSGDDVLRGDRQPNRIEGGGGRDRIDGRGGPDTLQGGDGADVIRGQAGNDTLQATDPGDRAIGGPGDDHLAGLAPDARLDAGPGDDTISLIATPAKLTCGGGSDLLSASTAGARSLFGRLVLDGCERVVMRAGVATVQVSPTRAADGALAMTVACRRQGTAATNACRGTIRIALSRAKGPPLRLASGTFDLVAGASRRVRFALRPAGGRALHAHPRPLIAVTVTGTGVADPTFKTVLPMNLNIGFAEQWRVHAP